jgi:hypothetical protein
MIEDENARWSKKRQSGNWVTPNEMGNELGNESARGKGLIFATGLRHNLRQAHDSTCDIRFV